MLKNIRKFQKFLPRISSWNIAKISGDFEKHPLVHYISLAILKFLAKFYHYYFCSHVEGALNEFNPQVVIYNAGTDIMEGDSLGLLSVTKQVTMSTSLVYDNVVCPLSPST